MCRKDEEERVRGRHSDTHLFEHGRIDHDHRVSFRKTVRAFMFCDGAFVQVFDARGAMDFCKREALSERHGEREIEKLSRDGMVDLKG